SFGHRVQTANKSIKVVAAHPAQDFWKAALNLTSMFLRQPANHAITCPFQILLAAFGLQFTEVQLSGVNDAPVGQDHPQLQDVVDCLAVHDGTRARRVVGNHAADGSSVGGGNVGGELETVCLDVQVEIVKHAAGANSHPALLWVDLQDLMEVLG